MPAGAVTASCAGEFEDVVADQEVLFVGRVDRQRDGFARFDVEEVWRGPGLAQEVWVQGGQDQPPWPTNLVLGVSSSNDATFDVGSRYLVGASHDFRTNDCIVAAVDDAVLDDLRPELVREPERDGAQGTQPPLDPRLLTAGTVLALAGAVGVLVWGLRRRRRSS